MSLARSYPKGARVRSSKSTRTGPSAVTRMLRVGVFVEGRRSADGLPHEAFDLCDIRPQIGLGVQFQALLDNVEPRTEKVWNLVSVLSYVRAIEAGAMQFGLVGQRVYVPKICREWHEVAELCMASVDEAEVQLVRSFGQQVRRSYADVAQPAVIGSCDVTGGVVGVFLGEDGHARLAET